MTVDATLPDAYEAELNAELAALAAARGAEGVSEDYLRFAGLVARAQTKARLAIRAVARPDPVTGPGEPGALLSLDEVRFEDAILLDLLRDLADASKGEGRTDHLEALVEAAEEDSGILRRLVMAATLGDDARPLRDAAGRLGLQPHALVLVARLLAAPFLVEARRRRADVPGADVRDAGSGDGSDRASSWRVGHCPTCSATPSLAVLRLGDGARRLICLLCGDAWSAPRLMCPSCGTFDQAQLGTLSVSGDDARWIEVCDACHRYLKTVDQRLLPEGYEIVPRAEDARTLHLDLIAEREGYLRPSL